MNKKLVIIILIGVLLGFLTGFYLYKINKIEKEDINIKEESKKNNNIIKKIDEETNNILKTSSKEEKTSPNCRIILKTYYKSCEHIIETKKNIEKANVNVTEQELKEKFPDWEIQKFTAKEIVLYKEVEGFCNEHYLLKEKNGYIAIYQLNEEGETKFFNLTDIAIKYLDKKDIERFKTGITVYTNKELNKLLEDFE